MKSIIALFIVIILCGCSKNDLIQYQENNPQLFFSEYFNGNTKGWGIVQDRSGTLIRQFVVHITGTVEQDTIVLVENFNWSDGEKSTRTWTITNEEAHTYTGVADDVVGTARGTAYSNVLNWQYDLNIVVDGSSWQIHLDDWMYLQSHGVLINKTRMSKFGIHLGDITISFQKLNLEEV